MVIKTKSSKKKFEYRARTADQVGKRASQTGFTREGFVKSDFNTWTPADGTNRIRILPPTWDDADHYGMDIWGHYGIGPDRSSFLCLQKHQDEPCPVCEERQELYDAGDEDEARPLLARKRVAMWIIDRKEESKGAQLWCAPWTLDQEIAKQSSSEDGEVLAIDHPEEGYDVIFTREGERERTKYTGVKLARKESPIADDEDDLAEIMEFIIENPVPSVLEFSDYDHMKKTFAGAESKKKSKRRDEEEEEEEDEKPKKKAGKSVIKKGKEDKKAKKKDEEEEEESDLPSWDEVHDMDEEELGTLAEANDVEFGDKEFDSLEEAQDYLCEQLEIEKPKKAKAGKKSIVKGKKKDEEEDEEEGEDDEDSKTKKSTSGWRSKLGKMKKK